ncbi:MAG TPA: aquaporin, partial [Candidatus Saccharimonadales bacterium]|nr:aquaporin [Candidatus Saccharimonadales bacterium]
AVEAVITYIFVTTVFGTAVAGRGGNAAGIAIGLALAVGVLIGCTLTGASMNPARTLGPALATGDLSYLWMYIVGPFLGAAVAALTYNIQKPEA